MSFCATCQHRRAELCCDGGTPVQREFTCIWDLNGAQGRNRTTDTRIFNPELNNNFQGPNLDKFVKPATKHQRLSRHLSNLPAQRKTAEGAATHLNGNAKLSASPTYQEIDRAAIAGGAHA